MNLNKLLSFIFTTSLELNRVKDDPYRTNAYIFEKVDEEVGEMATELLIQKNNFLNLSPGKDGLAGETVDAFVSIVDFYSNQQVGKCKHVIAKELIEALNNEYQTTFVKVEDVFNHAFIAYDGKLDSESVFKGLVALKGEINCQMHIDKGLSYKLPEPGKLEKLTVQFIALNMFYYELISDKTTESTVEDFCNTVFVKMNKWRKTRGFKEIDINIFMNN